MKNSENVGRRSFLKKAWAWLGVIAGIEFTAIAFNMFSPGKRAREGVNTQYIKTIGFVDQITPDTAIPFKNGMFYFVRLKDGGMMALSLSCTHLGCSVNWNSAKNKFICPCHSSAFDIEGRVLSPPAPRPLDLYQVEVSQGLVKVKTNKKIRRNGFQKSDLVYA